MQVFDIVLSGGQPVTLTTDELIITEEQAHAAALTIALKSIHGTPEKWQIGRLNIGGQGDVFAFYRWQGHPLEIDLCPEGSDLFSARLNEAIERL